ncbi:hypothetical protein P0082_07475 [Candidatus Haliotispira prima]|uniref:Uncharacterized protein n=1 Tax=Candidatus Haliotispira prima TaxID=3034016 RepID=A0ABY8MEN4_9SPIO|nr:hypothetical protein P0082_07475 [Candidatus Haliotispira prima]
MNRLLFFSLLFFVLLLEIFLPRWGDLEISLRPQKVLFLSKYQVGTSYVNAIGKLNVQADSEDPNDYSGLTVPFRLGLYYGFHDRDLNLLSFDVLRGQLPLSHQILGRDFYLDFSGEPGYVVIRDVARREIGRFPGSANAHIVKNTIYQFRNEGHSLYRYNRKGEPEWRSDLLPYISGLDNNVLGDTLISYVNGRVILLNQEGKLDNEYISSGSRINSVYGVALSTDSQNIALIAGLDRQRFVFLKKQQGTYLFQYAKELPNQLRNSQWLSFSDYNPYVFYNSSAGISVYDFRYEENRLYREGGYLNQFGEQEESDIQFFVFGSDEGGSLIGIHGTKGELLRLQLRGHDYSLQVQGDTMYFGQDNLIASYRTEYL